MPDETKQVIDPAAPAAPWPVKRPYEEWAAEKKTEAWIVKAAAAGRRWPIGAEMTEADFDQAMHDTANIPLR